MLVAYLTSHRDRLSEDSLARLERNPLRILDSKDKGDREVVAGAPLFSDYLTDGARAFFDRVRAGLDDLGLAYEINPRLVRGLDYYCHTAFEYTTEHLGAQGTVPHRDHGRAADAGRRLGRGDRAPGHAAGRASAISEAGGGDPGRR